MNEYIKERVANEDSFRYWDDDSLNIRGRFYDNLARLTVIYGSFRKAWKELKGDTTVNFNRIRKNAFFNKQIKNWMYFFMEQAGINRENFITKTDEFLNILMDKARESSPNSATLPALVGEIKDVMDMIGGDWLEMSKRENNQQSTGFYMPIQQSLQAAKSKPKQIQEIAEVEDVESEPIGEEDE